MRGHTPASATTRLCSRMPARMNAYPQAIPFSHARGCVRACVRLAGGGLWVAEGTRACSCGETGWPLRSWGDQHGGIGDQEADHGLLGCTLHLSSHAVGAAFRELD